MPSDSACILVAAAVVWSGTAALFFGAAWHNKSFGEKCKDKTLPPDESGDCLKMEFEIGALIMVGSTFALASLIMVCVVHATFARRSQKVAPKPPGADPESDPASKQVTIHVSACSYGDLVAVGK